MLLAAALGVAMVSSRGSPSAKNAVPEPRVSVRFPNPWPEPPPRGVSDALDGLTRGDNIAGFVVRAVSPVHEARIVVDVERGDVGFRVWIQRRDSGRQLPPAKTEKYALYVVQPRPTTDAIGDDDQAAVLKALAARLRRREKTVPLPAGL